MGVRRLQTFIEENGYARVVDIEKEILAWKTKNPKLKPIIVFNVFGLCCLDGSLLCGGCSIEFDDKMEKFFIRLKKCGAKLVFIQSIDVGVVSEEMWIKRRNNNFQLYVNTYEEIANRKSVTEIVDIMAYFGSEWKASPNLGSIASKHGEYLYVSAGRDCDVEAARYATKHGAMAVFSTDTDFLIFEGNWKFWNYKHLDFETFTAMEYDRDAIGELLLITPKQRPLLATLVENDFTKAYSDELHQFYYRLGRPLDKFQTVADFIRRNVHDVDGDLSEEVIDLCAVEVFGRCADDDKRQLIRDSVNSYHLDLRIGDNQEIDPIEAALMPLSVKAVKNYRQLNIDLIQAISIPFNDMATPECSTVLTDFLVELLRKKMGIVYHDEASDKRFKILLKKSRAESFAATLETPIRPDCPMPVLIDLLTKDDSDDELNETRWNLLAWMLSISDDHRDALQYIDPEFRVTCATLLVLVQKRVLSIEAADGFLITEMAVKKKRALGNEFPQFLEACHVRAAHIYRTVHSDINYGFMTAGLISSTTDLLRFDGVYFQNLMAAKKFPKDLVKAIQFYRIYAD